MLVSIAILAKNQKIFCNWPHPKSCFESVCACFTALVTALRHDPPFLSLVHGELSEEKLKL